MSSETIGNLGAGKKPGETGGVIGGLKKSNNTNFMDDEDEEDDKKKGRANAANKFDDDEEEEESFDKGKNTKKPVTAESASSVKMGGNKLLIGSATGSEIKGQSDKSKVTVSKNGGAGDQDDEEEEEEEEDKNKPPAKGVPKGGFGKAPISFGSSQSSTNTLNTVGGKNQPSKGPAKDQAKKVVEDSEEEEEDEEDSPPKKGPLGKAQALIGKPAPGKKPAVKQDDSDEEDDNGNFFNPV